MYILMSTDVTYDFKSLLNMISEKESAVNLVLAHSYYGGDLNRCLIDFNRRFIVHTDESSYIHALDFPLDDERNDDVFYIHSGKVTDELFNEVTLRRLILGKPVNFEHLRLSANAVDVGSVIQLMLNECATHLGRPERIYGIESNTSSRIVPIAYYGKCAAACRQLINSKLDI